MVSSYTVHKPQIFLLPPPPSLQHYSLARGRERFVIVLYFAWKSSIFYGEALNFCRDILNLCGEGSYLFGESPYLCGEAPYLCGEAFYLHRATDFAQNNDRFVGRTVGSARSRSFTTKQRHTCTEKACPLWATVHG